MPQVRFEDSCDKCGNFHLIVRRLEMQGGAVHLCRKCWKSEMAWRRELNKEVATPYDVFDFYNNDHD